MSLEVGAIFEGKVTGITKFGAFVGLEGGKSGLVHISEVANAYVSDINEFLSVGQQVKVKVVSIAPDGKISLSIKKAAENTPAEQSQPQRIENRPRRPRPVQAAAPETNNTEYYQPQKSNDQSFEEKLKQFMQDSGSKMSGSRLYEQPRKSRRR